MVECRPCSSPGRDLNVAVPSDPRLVVCAHDRKVVVGRSVRKKDRLNAGLAEYLRHSAHRAIESQRLFKIANEDVRMRQASRGEHREWPFLDVALHSKLLTKNMNSECGKRSIHAAP